jgi:hypothetical protein
MTARPEVSPPSSLAAVAQGDEIQIQAILINSVRAYCEALDISVGDTVRCRVAGRAAILLVTPRGRSVSIDVDQARFIKVTHP